MGYSVWLNHFRGLITTQSLHSLRKWLVTALKICCKIAALMQ